VVVLDSNGTVWRWRPANAKGAGTLAVIQFRGTTDWGSDVIDIAAFDRSAESYNLYVADPSAQQVLRYAPAGDGSGYPTDPIGYLAAPASLDAVRQIMVDGDVYFLLAGDVERYQSGTKTSFALTLPDDTDLRPRVDFRLFTGSAARRSGVLELWDASNGRVIEFSKRTGEYIQQWVVAGAQASFSDVRGVYILEPPDGPAVLYWSTGTHLYSSVLEDLNAPAASPSPGSSPSPGASPSPSPST
jgi:hypothetical protein